RQIINATSQVRDLFDEGIFLCFQGIQFFLQILFALVEFVDVLLKRLAFGKERFETQPDEAVYDDSEQDERDLKPQYASQPFCRMWRRLVHFSPLAEPDFKTAKTVL